MRERTFESSFPFFVAEFSYKFNFLCYNAENSLNFRTKMSMLDKKNKQIDMLKYWLGILVAVFLAIGAYLVTNFRALEDWIILTSSLSLVGLFVAIIFVNQRINRHIDDLEDL